MTERDWKWASARKKNRWQKKIIVDLSGMFVMKQPEIGYKKEYERNIWFSPSIGPMSGLGRMYYQLDSWNINEKVSGWELMNKNKTSWKRVPRDDFTYIDFRVNRKCLLILEEDTGNDYIVGVLLDTGTILEELLV